MGIYTRSLPAMTLAVCAGLALTASALARVDHPEVEPNETKAQATPVTMGCGDTLSGTTTGTSTTVAGAASADTFLITTPTATPGIYQYTLTLSSAIAGHSATLRGLNQVTGVPGTTDSIGQTSITVGADRINKFYGFGNAGQIYYRVTGTTTTTAPYSTAMSCTTITPLPIAGTLNTGDVSIVPDAATGTALDTDYWLYDSNFNAIFDAGHDDSDTTPMVRNLGPGTYYLAFGTYNTANNLGSPADDGFRSGNVADFPNVLFNSSSTTSWTATVNISDVNGNTLVGTGSRSSAFEVVWFSFQVGGVPGPSVSNCSASVSQVHPGDMTTLSTTVTPGGSPTITGVTANLSAFGLGTVNMTDNGGGNYSYALTVPANQPFGSYNVQIIATDGNSNTGGCQVNLVVPITNDFCSDAIVVSTGTTAGDNAQATTDATVSCTTSGKDVWYSFTAAADGLYQFDTEGSTQGDTVLALFDSCGGGQLACDDDGGTGLLSLISYGLTADQNVKVRVASYGAAPAGGGLNLNITQVASGACCNNTTGACSITSSTTCGAGSTFQGADTTCDNNICGSPGACCSATGSCTTVLSSACTGNFAGEGTVCDASTCSLGACCTGSSCSILNPVACAQGGGTHQGAGVPCGGPFYSFATGATGFVDISGTGSIAATVSACDDCGETVSLPFGFSFLGNTYNDVWICSNGFIQFGGANNASLGNTTIPNTGVPNNFIAGLWDDLNPGSAGDIYYQLDGSSPNQTFTISWQNVRQFGNTDSNSFQIVLHEGSNNFELRYGAITNEATVGDYTIGFEDASGTSGASIAGADLGAGFVSYDASGITLPSPCNVSTTGACCAGSTCSVTASGSCTGANTHYAGDGTVCNVPGNNTSPCCKADYNQSGAVTVQDIFDFLNGYFTQSPAADINGASGVTVQDIFDFLSAYFTGC